MVKQLYYSEIHSKSICLRYILAHINEVQDVHALLTTYVTCASGCFCVMKVQGH